MPGNMASVQLDAKPLGTKGHRGTSSTAPPGLPSYPQLLNVDGTSTSGLDTDGVAQRLRGPADSRLVGWWAAGQRLDWRWLANAVVHCWLANAVGHYILLSPSFHLPLACSLPCNQSLHPTLHPPHPPHLAAACGSRWRGAALRSRAWRTSPPEWSTSSSGCAAHRCPTCF